MRSLDELRGLIAAEDREIVGHLARRLELVLEVAHLKGRTGLSVMQPDQVSKVLDRAEAGATDAGLSATFARELFELIIREACRLESQAFAPRVQGTTAIVFGAMGTAGGITCEWLDRAGISTTRVDLKDVEASGVVGDVLALTPELMTAVSAADLIVLATPSDVTHRAAEQLLVQCAPHAVVIDLLSSKTSYSELVARLDPRCAAIGLNPMFGRNIAPANPVCLAVTYRTGSGCPDVLSALRGAGLTVLRLADAGEHDRLCARWQALAHAALLAFGHASRFLEAPSDPPDRAAPPPYQLLEAMVSRMLRAGPETYAEIQSMNPYAAHARSLFAAAALELAQGGSTAWNTYRDQVMTTSPGVRTEEGEGRFLLAARALIERVDQPW
ncbi:prephenate dehydrogenase/arogenate dehydrogenase family protein [Dactylosporangium sp. NPDC050588]|uniref:prephenate dehydrogenase/arogenate dehydrogenase family protein n=1 Tax=Dactylosporangium sp. NPDC050588 TaxID=3157211 RepID=UPI0033FF791B